MDGKEKYYTCNTRWMGKKSIIHVTLDGWEEKKSIIHVTLDGWERKVLYM